MVEGVVDESAFLLRDNAPVARWSHDQELMVVLSETDESALRVVTLHVPEVMDTEGVSSIRFLDTQPGAPRIDVAFGPLEVTYRSDGTRIVSTATPRFIAVQDGDLQVERVGEALLGEFRGQLVDGGWLTGSFVVDLPAQE